MRLQFLAIVSLLSLSAQQGPDASALLRQRTEALEKYHSYQYTEEMTMTAGTMTMPASTSVVSVLNPGKRRMESKAAGMDTLTVVSDGQYTWMYSPMVKRYTKTSDSETAADIGETTLSDPPVLANAKVIRSEILEITGEPHDCWVVESRVAEQPNMRNAVYTFWIDKTLGLDLQTTTTATMNLPGQPESEMHSKTVKRSLKLNEILPPSLFVFTPPDGAKESAELFPGMPGTAAPKSTKSSSPGEPQAYVPQLNPVERIEPFYPQTARENGLQGMVDLLLTIDTQGRVVHAEALSGRELFRPAAIAAVKHWKFSPVMRNGKAVSAYTDVMVNFLDGGKSTKSDDFGENMADDMTAAQRINELQAKFPRSPEQILADTEQNVSVASEGNRAAALPQLAKAAVDAGALDKATAYANELLRSATDPKDWNYGNAIYDGNSVLGQIALRRGNVEEAKQYLIKAAQTPGSPQLDSFGPDLTLARELAKKGERDTVLEYLSLCRVFWKMGGDSLNNMVAAVRSGQTF